MSKFIFFSGKGGVGKTSMACTTAVRYADEGHRTFIVTTDPASNLADVFEQPIGHQITAVDGVPNLWAMEIDPDRATEEYKDRALEPVRAAFPPAMVEVIEEQMSGPCTSEVAAFDRFTDFLDEPFNTGQQFDVIIFDTAPTGHTLRLLELPFEWNVSIETATEGSGQTCIGPAAAIQDAKSKYERAMGVLRDPVKTTFTFVLQPEAIAIRETQRAIGELSKLDIHAAELIVNGVIPVEDINDPLFVARAEMQQQYLERIQAEFLVPARYMILLPGEIRGVERLRQVGNIFFDGARESIDEVLTHTELPVELGGSPEQAVGRLMPNGSSRTLFFAGKGGVGKTVASCATAVWLAERGYKTLLLTTDPAAHLGDVLGVPVYDDAAPVAGVDNLWAANIDPKAAAEDYKAGILEDARQRGRPEAALKVMAEELDSPCTEEMAAFDRFIDFATQDEWDVVVFDTAPTGHTLRLIELPMDWSQQLDVKIFASVETSAADGEAKTRFARVIDMMRDPAKSTFVLVMYPESTPILEAGRAADDLRTLGIEPGLVVANFVVPAEQATTPFSRTRRAMQERHLANMAERFPVPMIQIPLLPSEVAGLDMLSELGKRIYGHVEREQQVAPVRAGDK